MERHKTGDDAQMGYTGAAVIQQPDTHTFEAEAGFSRKPSEKGGCANVCKCIRLDASTPKQKTGYHDSYRFQKESPPRS